MSDKPHPPQAVICACGDHLTLVEREVGEDGQGGGIWEAKCGCGQSYWISLEEWGTMKEPCSEEGLERIRSRLHNVGSLPWSDALLLLAEVDRLKAVLKKVFDSVHQLGNDLDLYLAAHPKEPKRDA